MDELRHHAHDLLPQLHVPLGQVHDEPHAVLITFPLSGHLLQHVESGGHGAAFLLLLAQGVRLRFLVRQELGMVVPSLLQDLAAVLPQDEQLFLLLLRLSLLLLEFRQPYLVLLDIDTDGLRPFRQRLLQSGQPGQAALLIGQAVQRLHDPVLLLLQRRFRLIAGGLKVLESFAGLVYLLLQRFLLLIGKVAQAVQGLLALGRFLRLPFRLG